MHTVTIHSSGEQFTLPHGTHLADADELQFGGLVFGCRAGACGICLIEVLAGAAHLSACQAGEAELLARLGHAAPAARLACQCRLLGDIRIAPHTRPPQES